MILPKHGIFKRSSKGSLSSSCVNKQRSSCCLSVNKRYKDRTNATAQSASHVNGGEKLHTSSSGGGPDRLGMISSSGILDSGWMRCVEMNMRSRACVSILA